MKNKMTKIVLTFVLVISMLLSIFVVAPKATSPASHSGTIASLDEKNTTVKELAAASAATSAAITLLPGDAGTPIADELADMSTYFLIIISALYLEKYLLTITGFAAFKFIIPVALALFIAYIYSNRPGLKKLAAKLLAFGLAIFLVIPVSIKASDMIEDTYQSSIQETIDSAKAAASEIEEEAAEEEEIKEVPKEEPANIWSATKDKLEDIGNKIGDTFDSTVEKVKEGVTGSVENLEGIMNRFIEALAVMIVTSCVIPILILLCFVWMIKAFLEVDINIPKLEAYRRSPERIEERS